MLGVQPVKSAKFESSSRSKEEAFRTYPDLTKQTKLVEITQHEGEIQLLETSTLCNLQAMSSMRDRMSGIDSNKIKSILKDSFYNPEAMHATMCSVNSIFYSSPSDIEIGRAHV